MVTKPLKFEPALKSCFGRELPDFENLAVLLPLETKNTTHPSF